MGRIETLLKLALWMAVLLCGFIILDYLALHDIYKDYVSQTVLGYLNIELPAQLPAWTDTALEWNAVTINYLIKTFIAVFNIILIVNIRNIVQKSERKNLEQQ
jgi:hypothetical protein